MIKTQVSILHQDYPTRVRELVETKLLGLGRFDDHLVSVRALLQRIKEDHRVEIVANVGRGTVLVADARGDAFSSTLDESLQRMTRQLKRRNGKHIDRHRRGRRA